MRTMEEFQQNLGSIKKILQKNQVVLAFIFGSAANGKLTKLSDLDFAVLLQQNVLPEKYQRIRFSLLHHLGKIIKNRPLDVAILNDASPLLAQMAVTRGRIIYSKEDSLKNKFQSETLKNYDDTAYLRKTYYRYLESRVRNNHLGETYA